MISPKYSLLLAIFPSSLLVNAHQCIASPANLGGKERQILLSPRIPASAELFADLSDFFRVVSIPFCILYNLVRLSEQYIMPLNENHFIIAIIN